MSLKTWLKVGGIGGVTLGAVLLSSLAVASLLPGAPDVLSTMTQVLKRQSNQPPWSESIPLPSGSTSSDPTQSILDALGKGQSPWSEQIPGQSGQVVENYLICQLMGDIGSLPISIPGFPNSHCASILANQTIKQPNGQSETAIATLGTTGPNPTEVRGESPTPPQIASAEDALTLNPLIRQRDLSNLYDQTLARSTAAPMVGKTGTQWMVSATESTGQTIQHSQKSAQQVQQLAESAKSLSVTQDVMKNNSQMQGLMANMLVDQAILNGKTHASLLGLQQEQAMMLLNQANLSEGIDEMNRRQRSDRLIEAAAAARSPLYLPGMYSDAESGGK